MTDRKKQDAWLMTALDVPMEVVVDAGDQSSEQDRVGSLVWEGATLRAQSALRQLAAEMDRRGGTDYQKAAAMVRSAQEKLAQPLDSAKSVAQMKSWILTDELISGCDDVLHLTDPLLVAVDRLATTFQSKGA
ncbi:hypothetical protein ACS5PN_03940 [Roseateles sp. NT4]|uniref:hypothetical protein n=1 Tax=Roseateles sp. NT4 TaxID=3453715 RepID=UPI003EED6ECF